MFSARGQEIFRHAMARHADRAAGQPPSFLRLIQTGTGGDIPRLPIRPGTQAAPAQNASGQTIFVPGYSALGGGHVLL